MIKQTYIGVIFALVGLILSGCSTPFAPGASFTALSKTGMIHSSPSLSESISKKKTSDSAICLGRGADTAFETDDRTPSVLITRELMYRACELATNFNLTKQEATAVYLKTLNVVSQGWQKETERTTITFSDTLSNSNVNSITESSTTSGSAAALSSGIKGSTVGATAPGDQGAIQGYQAAPVGVQDPNQVGGVPSAGYPPQPGQ